MVIPAAPPNAPNVEAAPREIGVADELVVNDHTKGLTSARPVVSWAPVVIVAVQVVMTGRLAAGEKVAVRLAGEYVTVPVTGVPEGHASKKVDVLIVPGAMSLLNTAVTLLLTATPVTIGVVAAGTVEVTVGGEPGAPGPTVPPPTPNTGSCPPQAVSTAISEDASQVEQRKLIGKFFICLQSMLGDRVTNSAEDSASDRARCASAGVPCIPHVEKRGQKPLLCRRPACSRAKAMWISSCGSPSINIKQGSNPIRSKPSPSYNDKAGTFSALTPRLTRCRWSSVRAYDSVVVDECTAYPRVASVQRSIHAPHVGLVR